MTSPISTFENYRRSGIHKARELYSPFPYKCLQAHRIIGTMTNKSITHRLRDPWDCVDTYVEAVIWLTNTDAGKIDPGIAVTTMGGKVFHHYINFKSEEDKLMFLLKFPEFA